MRRVAVFSGGLLLIVAVVLIALADAQRVDSVQQIRTAIAQKQTELDGVRDANYKMATKVTAMRSQVAQQDAELADSTGLLNE